MPSDDEDIVPEFPTVFGAPRTLFATQTAHNPREADCDSSNALAFDSDLGSWIIRRSTTCSLLLSGLQYLVSSCSGTTVPKELDTRRRARDAIFLTGCTPSSYKLELGFTICISLTLSREVYCVVY